MEELVKIETAKLAKEFGFKERVCKYYDTNGMYYYGMNEMGPMIDWDWNSSFKERTSAPPQSVLQRWIREKHGLHLRIVPVYFHENDERNGKFEFIIYDTNDVKTKGTEEFKFNDVGFKMHFFDLNDEGDSLLHDTYEDALENGLLEAFNLIKKK